MRIGRRLVRGLCWGAVLLLSILGGGLWFAYSYMTNGETAARLIRESCRRFLPGAVVLPGKVELRPLIGELKIKDMRLYQWIHGRSGAFQTLWVPWLRIGINPRKLLDGELDFGTIIVAQPTLRLCHRADGSLNLEGLFADPWPGPMLAKAPPIIINDGTIEIVPDEIASTRRAARRSTGRAGPGGEGATRAAVAATNRPADDRDAMVFRQVGIKIEQVQGALFRFDGTAQGDGLDEIRLSGSIDVNTGRVDLGGRLTGLTLSEGLARRAPRELRPAMKQLGLAGGVADLELKRASYDPQAPAGKQVGYALAVQLRDGVWECPHLPFPVNKLSADLSVEDGLLKILRAEGFNGGTVLRAHGAIQTGDPQQSPIDLHVELVDLELDWRPGGRLRGQTPPEYDELWDVFQPRGVVDARFDVVRGEAGGPVELGARVDFKDVAAKYRHFAYQLEHLRGWLELKNNLLTIDLQTSYVGGRPLRLKGAIKNPGIDAVVDLELEAESVPIDQTLLGAFQPEVRKVVDEFRTQGSVRAHADVHREPMAGRPEGLIFIDADIDLNKRCSMQWAKLPYPVRNLTGRLEIHTGRPDAQHPDRWIFRDMRGENGQEVITASGNVEKLPGPKLANGEDPLRAHVELKAQNLPFSQELRTSLPDVWDNIWNTLNPTGACDVEATVDVEARKPDRNHIVIVPRPESNVRLVVPRDPQPALEDPGGVIELRMDDVRGRFVFDDGAVAMNDVAFQFRGAPVRCDHGKVVVQNNGRFELNAFDLWVKDLRIDMGLRQKMPPLMAQLAQRLDDGTFTARGDLTIGWSGVPGQPAWCQWNKVLVVLNDNTIQTGVPMEHIQGELEDVRGLFDGRNVSAEGTMRIDSVVLLGQQVTQIAASFRVGEGVAELVGLRGRLLGGELQARGRVRLDPTPSYAAAIRLQGALLEEYARTLGGRRPYRGKIDAWMQCSGLGSDIHSLQGRGEAHISEGDLGKLPVLFRIASLLNPTRARSDAPGSRIKTAFDSADVVFNIEHGFTTMLPIKFTGNAFSLEGRGSLDPQANLDLRLRVLLGRDHFHVPVLSDLTREAASQFLIVRVSGTPAYPTFRVEPLPQLKRDGGRAEPSDQ